MIYYGEDILSAEIPDARQRSASAGILCQSGVWEEVVTGITDITVKFDPLVLDMDAAKKLFNAAISTKPDTKTRAGKIHILPAHFGPDDAPDNTMVADALQIPPETLPNWLASRNYHVAMMGFQPGFAYLHDNDSTNLPEIHRLATPRKLVKAGSIGMLGNRACIYAQDGPGGWPIIGRVDIPLVQSVESENPFLLAPHDHVQFKNVGD